MEGRRRLLTGWPPSHCASCSFRAGLPQAGAGAEQAGCGWDVFIETWTQQQKLRSGSKARELMLGRSTVRTKV